jgi:hypothetical protein
MFILIFKKMDKVYNYLKDFFFKKKIIYWNYLWV